jgi:hypothetical protein
MAAVDYALSLPSSFSEFVSSYTGDVIVIAALFGGLMWFSVRYGKARIVALILSLYVGLLFSTHVPASFANLLGEGQGTLSQSLIFALIVVASVFLIGRATAGEFSLYGFRRYADAVVLSTGALLLILAFWYHVLPLQEWYEFGKPIRDLFASKELFFWWLAAPLAALLIASRRF